MSRVDIETLVERTRVVLAQPDAGVSPTDNAALDAALADLAQRKREGRALELPRLGFWDASSPPAHDLRR